MNQTLILNKTLLASAIALSLAGTNAQAVAPPDSIEITNMSFGDNFASGGFLNRANEPGPDTLDQVNDFDPVASPLGRELKPGIDAQDFTGTMFSKDNFNSHTWLGTQQTVFMDNTAEMGFVFDEVNSPQILGPNGSDMVFDCTLGTPVGVTVNTGPCSPLGSYNFNNTIASDPDNPTAGTDYIGNMTANQFAVGIFFDWNCNNGIALLEIFTCDDTTHVCTGEGVPMENGPFASSVATFSGGPSPISCPDTVPFITQVNEQFDIAVADVTDACSDVIGAATVVNFETTSVNGGVITSDGTNFNYTPLDGFEGPDSFIVSIEDDRNAPVDAVVNVQVGGQLQNNFTMLAADGSTMGGSNDVDIEWDEVSFNSNNVIKVDANGFGIPTDPIGVMTVGSPQKFFGFNWFANNVRVFKGPAKFRFDISCTLEDYQNSIVDCNRPLPVGNIGERYAFMELQPDEIGGHMIFDWGSAKGGTSCGLANCDIDVINVWAENIEWNDPDDFGGINELWIGAAGVPPANNNDPTGAAKWVLTPIDSDGDGINGQAMIDGAFNGSSANFNYKPDKAGVAPPDFEGTISDVKVDAFSMGLWSLLGGLLSLVGLRRFKNNK